LIAKGTTLKSFLLCQPTTAAAGQLDESTGFILHGWARAGVPFAISAFFNPYMTTIARFAAARNSPYLYGKFVCAKFFEHLGSANPP
jgi:hypothetical protein